MHDSKLLNRTLLLHIVHRTHIIALPRLSYEKRRGTFHVNWHQREERHLSVPNTQIDKDCNPKVNAPGTTWNRLKRPQSETERERETQKEVVRERERATCIDSFAHKSSENSIEHFNSFQKARREIENWNRNCEGGQTKEKQQYPERKRGRERER